ncbi:MAG: serine hydrolase [Pseudomonadota bacterium]|nr:serine hydrolase [Pseudomonadota bacterium]
MAKRLILIIAALIVAGGLLVINLSPLGRSYLPSGTGLVAKQVCSLTFVSGLDTEQAKSIYVDPLLGPAETLIRYDLDAEAREVRSGVLGLFWRQRAVYRDGLGCTLVHGRGQFDDDLALPPRAAFDPLPLDTAHRDGHFDATALNAAIDAAFGDPETDPRNTLGVAVLHEGRLVAERYAPGASRETRFHGWSMTKSAMATLAGVLEQDGLIDIEAEGQAPALAAVDDSLTDITIEDMLRMAGGLAIAERNDGWDPNSRMLMTQSDMAHFAATRDRLHGPGEHWQYMSGNTILATHAMQQQLGDTLSAQVAGLRARLFEPLGIHSAILEPDESGTFQGSSYLYATAHDWARLGQLYANDGMVDGERLLPEGWVDLVRAPTEGSDGTYGMGFWLPEDHENLPDGTFMMRGFQSQLGYIMPAQDLVIVRFGATNGVPPGTSDLAAGVAAALRDRPSPHRAGNTD